MAVLAPVRMQLAMHPQVLVAQALHGASLPGFTSM